MYYSGFYPMQLALLTVADNLMPLAWWTPAIANSAVSASPRPTCAKPWRGRSRGCSRRWATGSSRLPSRRSRVPLATMGQGFDPQGTDRPTRSQIQTRLSPPRRSRYPRRGWACPTRATAIYGGDEACLPLYPAQPRAGPRHRRATSSSNERCAPPKLGDRSLARRTSLQRLPGLDGDSSLHAELVVEDADVFESSWPLEGERPGEGATTERTDEAGIEVLGGIEDRRRLRRSEG